MQLYVKRRQWGKTTEIAREISWCAFFGELPVCVFVPNWEMLDTFKKKYLYPLKLTREEYKQIIVVNANVNEYFEAYSLPMLRGLRPKRIYIDEVFHMNVSIIRALKREYDDIIFAYGTPRHYVLPNQIASPDQMEIVSMASNPQKFVKYEM